MKPFTAAQFTEWMKDPSVTHDKFLHMTDYNATLHAAAAARAFQRAFQKLQAALPIIDENGTITFRDGRTWTYATNDLIQETILPICHKYGFTLSFKSKYPTAGTVHVTGYLKHKEGHVATSEYEARVDMTGGKSDAQGRKSVISFGHRTITRDILNLITRGHDNDGAAQPVEEDRPKPDGYREFENALRSAAMVDSAQLTAVWAGAVPALREAVPQILWDDLKAVAVTRDAHVL